MSSSALYREGGETNNITRQMLTEVVAAVVAVVVACFDSPNPAWAVPIVVFVVDVEMGLGV